MTLAEQLAAGIAELGLEINAAAQQKLLAYLELMAKWNRVYNLTALRKPEEWVTHHLLDSLSVLPHIRGPLVVDVGSGAGLPGLVLAMVRPDRRVVSVEAVDKKAAFQRQVAAELALTNMHIEGCRVEGLALEHGADTIVSRAFSNRGNLTETVAASLGARTTPKFSEAAVTVDLTRSQPDQPRFKARASPRTPPAPNRTPRHPGSGVEDAVTSTHGPEAATNTPKKPQSVRKKASRG